MEQTVANLPHKSWSERTGSRSERAAKPTVLVVDDEPLLLMGTAVSLENMGFRVESLQVKPMDTLEKIQEKVQRKLDESDPPIDLVLTDLEYRPSGAKTGVPFGLNVIDAAKDQVPVLVFTGTADATLKQECMDRGAAGVFSKPGISQEMRTRMADCAHRGKESGRSL